MSRITAVTILLIVLINSLCSSSASPGGISVYIRKCRCTEFSTGRFKCPKPLRPTKHKEQRDLIDCLCKTMKDEKRSDLLQLCRLTRMPTTML